MKKSFVAIIGAANAGKSTIIQSLTGCEFRTFRGRITDEKTKQWIYVIASSPQEKPMSEAELSGHIRNAAAAAMCLGMVIALQPRPTRTRLSMEKALQMAGEYKKLMRPYVFVITNPHDDNKAERTPIKDMPKFLGTPIPLDARRFAHMNASKIGNIVGWFKKS